MLCLPLTATEADSYCTWVINKVACASTPLKLNSPFALVDVLFVVPFTVTVALAMGSPLLSTILPFTSMRPACSFFFDSISMCEDSSFNLTRMTFPVIEYVKGCSWKQRSSTLVSGKLLTVNDTFLVFFNHWLS